MHLVDDVDLVFSFRRRIGNFIHNFPDIIHAIIAGCINFNYIHAGPRSNSLTGGTAPTGASLSGMLTINCLSKQFGYGCFSRTSGSAKKIGMAKTVCLYLILQCGHNVVLAFYIFKIIRSEFTVKGGIRHSFLLHLLVTKADS